MAAVHIVTILPVARSVLYSYDVPRKEGAPQTFLYIFFVDNYVCGSRQIQKVNSSENASEIKNHFDVDAYDADVSVSRASEEKEMLPMEMGPVPLKKGRRRPE